MQTTSLIGENINLNNSFFEETIFSLTKNFKIEEIIETGTYNGLGSTSVFARTGIKTISMESCEKHYNLAKNNLQNFPNVELHHASSLPFDEMEQFILEDDIYFSDLVVSEKIKIDGTDQSKDYNLSKKFYLEEVRGFSNKKIPTENLLITLIDNLKNQLVFLDSAGGVGFLEFKKFMTLDSEKLKNKILVLDDVSHVKHYRSVVTLKQLNHNVTISPNQRFAYCIFS